MPCKFLLLLLLYMLFVHALLTVLIIDSDVVGRLQRKLGAPPAELSSYYETLVVIHGRMDGSVPDNAVLFIGDSITQGLPTAAVHHPSVNYGIGTDTTRGVLKRIDTYQSVHRADAIVLAIGVNDQIFRQSSEMAENYRKILNTLPAGSDILVSAILPVDERVVDSAYNNERVLEFNEAIKQVSLSFDNTIFLDAGSLLKDNTGNLAEEFHIGDGLHLSTKGYAAWIGALQDTLAGRVTAPTSPQK